ncbi:heterokaryon incompatibility protein-domain-containing protein [Podospora fimiseda]|uniref:Heterokaryon incompatibility protein-domain-containing protein n=1 Tax=Podospora fimiseda TaxID=252190 RepID=A0AAN7BHT1_9PEZI|nr:heterokaryon incompatibility protein-domain-containing protein [Podospora fimiseda]
MSDLQQICHACQGLIDHLREDSMDPSNPFRISWNSKTELATSARTCPFCAAFLTGVCNFIEDWFKFDPDELLHVRVGEIYTAMSSRLNSPMSLSHGLAVIELWVGIIRHDVDDGSRILAGDVVFHRNPQMSRPNWSKHHLNFKKRLPTLNHWIQQCLSSHPKCKNHHIKPNLPTRLLDLGVVGQSQDVIKLIESESIPEGRQRLYTTLSHCWGSLELPKTTISTWAQNSESGIMVSSLPKKFRDAIKLTRALSLRYLWIDSLCIIQDDVSDWQDEASRMSSYYQNSYLTIPATSAHDAQEGLFLDIDNPSLYLAKDAAADLVAARVMIPHPTTKLNDHSPLTRRGWVLQEEDLSSHMIHCMTELWFWKCRSMEESEDEVYQAKTTNRTLAPEIADKCTEREEYMFRWMGVADEYARRHLTYEKDRLPALAGLVEFYQCRINHDALLGAWKSTIGYDLGWRIHDPDFSGLSHMGPVMLSPIPSWSWLSQLGQHEGPRWSLDFGLPAYNGEEKASHLALTKAAEWDIAWSGPAMKSELLSTSLVVEGPVLTRSSMPSVEGFEFKADIHTWYDDGMTETKNHEIELVLLLWNAEQGLKEWGVVFAERCLLLEIVEKEPLTCRRIGVELRHTQWCGTDEAKILRQQFMSFSKDVPVRRIRLV